MFAGQGMRNFLLRDSTLMTGRHIGDLQGCVTKWASTIAHLASASDNKFQAFPAGGAPVHYQFKLPLYWREGEMHALADEPVSELAVRPVW